MDPRYVDQLLELILPIALILLALNVGAKMTGFGQKLVTRLTEKVTWGLAAIAVIWLALVAVFSKLSP